MILNIPINKCDVILYGNLGYNGTEKMIKYLKTLEISGIVTYVGPDTYALPSVELSESEGGKSRVLCVLPFTDYFKLTKVSKTDRVVMRGNVLVFSDEYDFVVVKKCQKYILKIVLL